MPVWTNCQSSPVRYIECPVECFGGVPMLTQHFPCMPVRMLHVRQKASRSCGHNSARSACSRAERSRRRRRRRRRRKHEHARSQHCLLFGLVVELAGRATDRTAAVRAFVSICRARCGFVIVCVCVVGAGCERQNAAAYRFAQSVYVSGTDLVGAHNKAGINATETSFHIWLRLLCLSLRIRIFYGSTIR